MRIRDRNGKDNNNSYFRKQITSWSSKHRNKKRDEKCYGLIFKKKHMKEQKDIAPMAFAEYWSLLKW